MTSIREFPDSGSLDDSTDEQLLDRWRDHDGAAVTQLFKRHYPSVARFFANRVGDGSDDLTQATFLSCLECIERFRGEASFRSLLFAIAHNKLRRHLRDRTPGKRQRAYGSELLVSSEFPSPVSVLVDHGEREQLLGALDRLPADTRAMFECFYWRAMPVKDIASALELPVSTVKTRMRRARKQLARELEGSSAGPAPCSG